jgi:hypothetical protein
MARVDARFTAVNDFPSPDISDVMQTTLLVISGAMKLRFVLTERTDSLNADLG